MFFIVLSPKPPVSLVDVGEWSGLSLDHFSFYSNSKMITVLFEYFYMQGRIILFFTCILNLLNLLKGGIIP
jgi:hypothetical protein